MGKSGLPLSVLSLGSWITFGKQINDPVAEKLMKTAYDHGINFLIMPKFMPEAGQKK